ncbi:unnamed protein product, partial [Notodromas monacha]
QITEPGYYEDGKFGIRLETIVTVVEKNLPRNFDGPYLGLEPVTFVPFEPKLICAELLSTKQKNWLNNYNALVRDKIGAELHERDNTEAYEWMMARTGPVVVTKPCKLLAGSSAASVNTPRTSFLTNYVLIPVTILLMNLISF